MKVFFLLFVFFLGCISLDQSPIATLTCKMCASGNGLSKQLLPEGMTCTDLDAAYRNLGSTDGCLGLGSAGNSSGSSNMTESEENAALTTKNGQLNEQVVHLKKQNKTLIYCIVTIVVILAISTLTLGAIIFVMHRHNKRVVVTNKRNKVRKATENSLYRD